MSICVCTAVMTEPSNPRRHSCQGRRSRPSDRTRPTGRCDECRSERNVIRRIGACSPDATGSCGLTARRCASAGWTAPVSSSRGERRPGERLGGSITPMGDMIRLSGSSTPRRCCRGPVRPCRAAGSASGRSVVAPPQGDAHRRSSECSPMCRRERSFVGRLPGARCDRSADRWGRSSRPFGGGAADRGADAADLGPVGSP